MAFQIFAGDNDDKYPFSATNGLAFNNTTNAWLHFQAMSNELASAKVLICPEDKLRIWHGATDFSNTSSGLMYPSNQEMSVSFFVGLGADEVRPQAVLSGDRNLAKSQSAVLYSSQRHGGAIHVNPTSVWSTNLLQHGGAGNIALGDASVQQASSLRLGDQLRAAARVYGATNNLLLFPQ